MQRTNHKEYAGRENQEEEIKEKLARKQNATVEESNFSAKAQGKGAELTGVWKREI